MGFYDYSVTDAQGNEFKLDNFRGKVVMVVNTATGCGFTPHYKDIEAIYERFHDQGFEVLDIPCNQFAGQTPGTDEEIHEFCSLNFGTEFPQFKKIEVNGENEHPLFAFLKKEKGFEGFDLNHPIGKILDEMMTKVNPDYAKSDSIKWNFTKFLIDREGNVVARFEPTHDIKLIEEAIKKLL